MKTAHKDLLNECKSYVSFPALVIGTDISALNIIRSLGRRGVQVYAVGSHRSDYGAVSRYAKFVFCEDLNDEKRVISCLIEISRNTGKRMSLFCTSDLHVLYVSKNRELLRPFFEFVLPDHKVVEMLMDKKNFYNFARYHGFSIPKTFISKNHIDLEEIASTISYPCVVKPLYHTQSWNEFILHNKKVIKANSSSHLKQELEDLTAIAQPLILQEWISGGDEQVYFCLAYLNRQGEPLALFTGRKLRQYPSLTGNTSIAESIMHQKLTETTLNILNASGCKGLCSVEFKYNAEDCSFRITEPTVGRVDLQEGISIQAGLDIPFIAYRDAVGISQSAQTEYKTGIKWINEPLEFNAFMTQIRNGGCRVGEFFRLYQGQRSYALLSADDPIPFLYFLKWAGKRSLRYLRTLLSKKSWGRQF